MNEEAHRYFLCLMDEHHGPAEARDMTGAAYKLSPEDTAKLLTDYEAEMDKRFAEQG